MIAVSCSFSSVHPRNVCGLMYWSNSCCSHPRGLETLDVATRRRLFEELGIQSSLQFLYKFKYQAQFDADGAEHELCSVFIGCSSQPLDVNHDEILAHRWISPEKLEMELAASAAAASLPRGFCWNGRVFAAITGPQVLSLRSRIGRGVLGRGKIGYGHTTVANVQGRPVYRRAEAPRR